MSLPFSKSQPLTAGAGYGVPILITSVNPSIMAIPGASGTMVVQYTTSDPSLVSSQKANWLTWPNGTVSTTTGDTPLGTITAVRASATTSDGTLEVCQKSIT